MTGRICDSFVGLSRPCRLPAEKSRGIQSSPDLPARCGFVCSPPLGGSLARSRRDPRLRRIRIFLSLGSSLPLRQLPAKIYRGRVESCEREGERERVSTESEDRFQRGTGVKLKFRRFDASLLPTRLTSPLPPFSPFLTRVFLAFFLRADSADSADSADFCSRLFRA